MYFKINNQLINDFPLEWKDLAINVNFESEREEPNLSVENLTFPFDVRDYQNGNIFEGVPFEFGENSTELFNGVIDLTKYKKIHCGKTTAGIKKINSLDNFWDKLNSSNFENVRDAGVINGNDYFDVQYLVEKEANFLEIAFLELTIFILTKEVIQSIVDISDQVSRLTSSVNPIDPDDAIGATIMILVYALYISLMLIQLFKLIQELLAYVISPIRTHKAITIQTMLEKTCQFLGVGYASNLDLSKYVYLPSKPVGREASFPFRVIPISEGIPKPSDYGYTLNEVFDISNNYFNTNLRLIDGVAHNRTKDDSFWYQQSTYQFPDLLNEVCEFNTSDIVKNKLIRFNTDTADNWTIVNFKGTNYGIKTDITNPQVVNSQTFNFPFIGNKTLNDYPNDLIKGYEEKRIPLALGNRKDGLNEVETVLLNVANVMDGLIDVFGGNSNFTAQVQSRVGMLKVSRELHSVAKMLYYENGSIPSNHRTFLSAEHSYKNFHSFDSFASQYNHTGQKTIYRDIEIPFCLSDFNRLVENPNFLYQGEQAQFTSLQWNVERQKATVDFFIRKPYEYNLIETYYAG